MRDGGKRVRERRKEREMEAELTETICNAQSFQAFARKKGPSISFIIIYFFS